MQKQKLTKENTMNAKIPFAALLPVGAVLVIGIVVAALYMGGDMRHANIDPASIIVPPPPADNSADTKAEIAVLVEDKFARATEVVAAIKKEASFDAVQIGPYSVGEYRRGKMFPQLAKVLSYSLPEVGRVLAVKQKEFNRARPSAIDPSVEPIVPVPNHPSYPADYMSQGRFVAYVLSYIDPAHQADYLSYSEEAAVRQEIAGVQYPLDNIGGTIFSEAIFTALLTDSEFAARLDAAKAEWVANIPHEAAQQ